MQHLGIDLSSSSKRPSAYALLDEDASLVTLDSFRSEHELMDMLDIRNSVLIAIDAPLGLPQGTCCLEESCPCAPILNRKGRMAEMELAQMRIGCFFTGKRSIIKTLIYRALQLSKDLQSKGYDVIEVYPYASKVVLFGDKIPAKNSREGLAFVKERLCQLIAGVEDYAHPLNHDRCDALIAAYTAALHHRNATDRLGVEQEGYIVVPKLTRQWSPVVAASHQTVH